MTTPCFKLQVFQRRNANYPLLAVRAHDSTEPIQTGAVGAAQWTRFQVEYIGRSPFCACGAMLGL